MLADIRRCALFPLLLALAACTPDGAAQEQPPAPVPPAVEPAPQAVPSSVILLIVDGMGPQQMALLWDWADAAKAGPTNLARVMEEGTSGLIRTGAFETPLTDSASSATAIASGVSTFNGAIGVTPDGLAAPTCLEDARDAGKRTGLVSTARITHATPAAFAAHVANRSHERAIAEQFVRESGVDVFLGGGAKVFTGKTSQDGATLLEEATAGGYVAVRTEAELDGLPADTAKVLGLFADSHIPYLIDRDEATEHEHDAPTLTKMTRRALDLLEGGDQGFFLMVEAGRVDHGGHGNDVAVVLGEMREFDDALGVALAYQSEHPETTVVVTADHETGGLCISAAGRSLEGKDFLDMAAEKQSISARYREGKLVDITDGRLLGIGHTAFYPRSTWMRAGAALERSATWSATFGSYHHTTTPVVIAAVGPGEEEFAGLHHNEYIGTTLRRWMQAK